jgi:hypothetical protein
MADLDDKKYEIETKFNTQMFSLLKKFKKSSTEMKGKAYISNVKKNLQLSIRGMNNYAMETFGPYLWNSRERIADEDVKYFLNTNCNIQIQQLSIKYKFDYNDSLDFLQFMRIAYNNFEEQQKREIINDIKTLLSIYTSYLMLCQGS